MNLSPRQLQILQLTADGLSLEQIAQKLGTNVKYVQNDRRRMYQKLGAENAPNAVYIGVCRGLIQINS